MKRFSAFIFLFCASVICFSPLTAMDEEVKKQKEAELAQVEENAFRIVDGFFTGHYNLSSLVHLPRRFDGKVALNALAMILKCYTKGDFKNELGDAARSFKMVIGFLAEGVEGIAHKSTGVNINALKCERLVQGVYSRFLKKYPLRNLAGQKKELFSILRVIMLSLKADGGQKELVLHTKAAIRAVFHLGIPENEEKPSFTPCAICGLPIALAESFQPPCGCGLVHKRCVTSGTPKIYERMNREKKLLAVPRLGLFPNDSQQEKEGDKKSQRLFSCSDCGADFEDDDFCTCFPCKCALFCSRCGENRRFFSTTDRKNSECPVCKQEYKESNLLRGPFGDAVKPPQSGRGREVEVQKDVPREVEPVSYNVSRDTCFKCKKKLDLTGENDDLVPVFFPCNHASVCIDCSIDEYGEEISNLSCPACQKTLGAREDDDSFFQPEDEVSDDSLVVSSDSEEEGEEGKGEEVEDDGDSDEEEEEGEDEETF